MIEEIERLVSSDIPTFVTEELQKGGHKPCVIIHGGIGAGKTGIARMLSDMLAEQRIVVGGILSPRLVDGDETVGYSIRDILSGEERPFAALEPPGIATGRFYITRDGIDFARRAIERAARTAQVVFVDEVGRLELIGEGHAPALRELLCSCALPIILVRSEFVTHVVDAFLIDRYESFGVDAITTAYLKKGGGR